MATLTRELDIHNLCSRKLQALLRDATLSQLQRRQIEAELHARRYPLPSPVRIPRRQWPLAQ